MSAARATCSHGEQGDPTVGGIRRTKLCNPRSDRELKSICVPLQSAIGELQFRNLENPPRLRPQVIPLPLAGSYTGLIQIKTTTRGFRSIAKYTCGGRYGSLRIFDTSP